MAIAVVIESGAKKTFARAIDWPGWSRSGKTEELALEALADAAARYAVVAETADEPFAAGSFDVVDHVDGVAGTDFGIPYVITDEERRPVTKAEAARLARLVEASWTTLDRVAGDRAGRAPEGSPRRRPRPRQDVRARRRGRLGLRPRDRAQAPAARPDRPCRRRGPSRSGPGGPPRAIGRRADRRAASGPPATPPAGSPGTPSTTPGRWRTAASRPEPSPDSGRTGRPSGRTWRSRRRRPASGSACCP